MNKKKILITGANGMLAHDFIRTQKERFTIIALEKKECDICEFPSCLNALVTYEPDIVLNLAAYTNVDDAEDIGRKQNIDINALGVYNLAKATSALGIPMITISSDYVFDRTNMN
ncbi:sugar nucleotide-binding protein [Candidatus Peregrinibacteria bacterium]|nr:sugar nucleotide-binding protein [Candidatus Peregrinibacteria bacterium]